MISFREIDTPFVIAEIGGNHEGDLEYAKQLLAEAASTGVDAIKFQSYSASRIVNKVQSPERHQHFSKFELGVEEFIELAEMCRLHGVEFMSSIWDCESIPLLDPYIAVHKVGSGDLTNYRLLKPLVETDKPICIATAMATIEEIIQTVGFIREVNPGLVDRGDLCVMHCVAMYGDPRDEYANLLAIRRLREKLPDEIVVGYSDHTCGNVAVKVALELGAKVIETHFTDDNSREFRDHHFAHSPEELADFVHYCRRRTVMMGDGEILPVPAIETPARIREFRRAIYLNRDMEAGEIVTECDITTLRPNEGIPAEKYFDLIGKELTVQKKRFEPMSERDFL